MVHSLNSLEASIQGTTIEVILRDTVSLDYGSCVRATLKGWDRVPSVKSFNGPLRLDSRVLRDLLKRL